MQKVVEFVRKGKAISLCSEQQDGLQTLRDPSERVDDKVRNKNGNDVTAQFQKGIGEMLKIVKLGGWKRAIL